LVSLTNGFDDVWQINVTAQGKSFANAAHQRVETFVASHDSV